MRNRLFAAVCIMGMAVSIAGCTKIGQLTGISPAREVTDETTLETTTEESTTAKTEPATTKAPVTPAPTVEEATTQPLLTIDSIATADIPQSIKDVFLADGPYEIGTGDGRSDFPEDRFILQKGNLKNFIWTQYTVVDFDGDGINELEFAMDRTGGGVYAAHVIFHDNNGTVYTYQVVYRAMTCGIDADGMYDSSGGADVGYMYTVSFENNAWNEHLHSYMNHGEYNIEGQEVSEDEYFKYLKDRADNIGEASCVNIEPWGGEE